LEVPRHRVGVSNMECNASINGKSKSID